MLLQRTFTQHAIARAAFLLVVLLVAIPAPALIQPPSPVRLVKDILLPPGDPSFNGAPGELTVMNGRLFFGAYDSTRGAELWSSDGTITGTKLVADIFPSTGSSFPQT
jgi:ELWxxDGT repeat protein